MSPDNKGRASLVSVITTPLGFFALALLIVEGFLGITVVGSGFTSGEKFWGMIVGAFLFLCVVVIVTILVWKQPQHLTFSESSHIAHDRMNYGNKEADTRLTEKQLESVPKVSDEQV